jgi:eukaryotic-like serine/threonine-protein kinase
MSVKQRYKVAEKIDAGGMAEIFRGYAFSLDGIQKQVAIKRIRPHLASNKVFIQMFIDEARLTMRLNHANITQVFDVGRAQGTYFLVMEFVDGANLRKISQAAAEKGYRIPVEIAILIILDVCKALAHAHEARDENGQHLDIVHRDVSPPNVLVSQEGEVKITDFGLAKAVTHLEATDPGVVKGKFSYLAPEATEGKPVDARSDMFSCGIILHELLTGRRLFMGKTDLETVDLVKKCDVAPPSALNPDVDNDLDEIVLRSLARDRKRRFQSARDMGDALARYLFSHNLKVTVFDVSQMMRMLFSDEELDTYPRRVVDIIREEVINLSSMGRLPGVTPTEGVQPLDLGEFQARKTAFEDIWTDFDAIEGQGDSGISPVDIALPTAGGDSSAGQAIAESSKAKQPSKKRGASPWIWVLLTLLGLGAAASIGYLVMFTDLL